MKAINILKYVLYCNETEKQGVVNILTCETLKEQMKHLFGSDLYDINNDGFSAKSNMIQRYLAYPVFYEYGDSSNGFGEWISSNTTMSIEKTYPDIVVYLENHECVRIWIIED